MTSSSRRGRPPTSSARASVRDAVRDYEPRVQLDGVTVTRRPEAPERVDIAVTYTVRRTNTRDSIVFPFYLARPGGLP